MTERPGRKALHELDKVLAAKPPQDGQAFSAATKAISALREEVIATLRRNDSAGRRKTLSHLNAVLSVVLGGHYPLGQVPWDELHKARGWLEDIVRKEEAQGSPRLPRPPIRTNPSPG